MIYTEDNGLSWQSPPTSIVVGGYTTSVSSLETEEEWQTLADAGIYRQLTEPGENYGLGYTPLEIVQNPGPEDDIDVAYEAINGTEAELFSAQRQSITNQIMFYLDQTNESQVSTRFDPARVVLMDEGIAAAKREQGRLDLTANADLGNFVLNFDPTTIGSIDTAKTLYAQTTVVLRDDPSLTPEQTADLEAVQPLYAGIANGTDDAVDVPSVPDSVRRKLGVTGEGYGTIRVRRFLDGGWWWLEFELVTRRELKAGDYWIALYNADGVYLSTPQLMKTADGKYFSDKSAVNSPQNSDQVGYQYTLCFQHINAPQFDRIVIAPGVHTKIDRVRWNGNAQGAVAAASTMRR